MQVLANEKQQTIDDCMQVLANEKQQEKVYITP
jgi:hypothetical protein